MKKVPLAAKAQRTSRAVPLAVPLAVSLAVSGAVPRVTLPAVVPAAVRLATPRRTNAAMSTETQASILKAAIASLAEHGYAGTTMAGIAARVGVSRAALVYHFDSKNTLMTAVTNAIYDEMGSMYLAAAHPALTPAERLLALFDVSYQFTNSLSQMAQIELLLAARRDPEFRMLVAPTIEARDHGFEEAWQRLTTDFPGSFARLALIRDFAVSVFRGITINRSLKNDTASFERQLVLLRKLLMDAM